MSLRGDFKRLDQMVVGLRRLEATGLRDVLQLFAVDVGTEVQGCFMRGVSPYGEVWVPLKNPPRRRRGGQPLRDTGRLQNSIHVHSTASAVTVTSNVVYAAIQNYGGTVHHAARSELRRYAISGQDKRRRVALNSSSRRSVRTAASIGESTATVPKRQFLPDAARGLPPRWAQRLAVAADQVQGQLRLGGL